MLLLFAVRICAAAAAAAAAAVLPPLLLLIPPAGEPCPLSVPRPVTASSIDASERINAASSSLLCRWLHRG